MGGPSAERLTALLGLLVVMLATLPRYLDGGHETRLSLMLMASAVVTVVVLLHWRLLDAAARQRVPGLLRRLGFCLLAGLAVMAAWYALASTLTGWQVLLSHGTTAGLLMHVLSLWWRQERSELR
ncbi:hypothetical protein IEI94_00335 [Halomonas sp. ML-15]|uniref:hypothetical protein n=1 Tax=Halomonas sp. ML-15 TaxID=2773305 RepID=UPI001746E3D9|nr:hypothetical protein [Halomonas sp. ML-15]MBD3894298.1 hypothetical protein [Halomonas sp. ML-15]